MSTKSLFWAGFVLILPVVLLVIVLPDIGFAKEWGIVPCDGTPEYPCNLCAGVTLIQNLINVAVFFAAFVGAAMFAWAGFLWLTNMGKPQKIEDAKKIFFNVTIGLFILLGAWFIVDAIMKTMLKKDADLGPWNAPCGQSGPSMGRGVNDGLGGVINTGAFGNNRNDVYTR